jgi:hypothetical protein
MVTEPFTSLMLELDAVVEACRGREPFVSSVVRDASNRSNRDWPWWGIEVQQTEEHEFEKRRVIATVTLHAMPAGEPGSFSANWLVRVWSGVGVDSYYEKGGWPLNWDRPSSDELADTMNTLLQTGKAAMVRAGIT